MGGIWSCASGPMSDMPMLKPVLIASVFESQSENFIHYVTQMAPTLPT